MEELYKAGKLRAIGVSNFGPDRYLDIQHFAEIKPAVNQIETHVFQQQKVAKEYLKKYGCQIESWGPFAEGRKDMSVSYTHLRAILFYCGYLQSEYAGDFLPKILGETLEAILSMFGDCIGRLLFKQTVEHNVMNHILASDTDIDAATYQKMRGMSYQEVVQTHGQISFPEVLRKEKAL